MRILSTATQIPRIRELLESYHFAEDVRIEAPTSGEEIVLFQGNADPEWLKDISTPGLSHFSLDLSGDGGRIFFGSSGALAPLREFASKEKISFYDSETLDLLTLEAGLPLYGRDTDAGVMAMEVWNYERFIHFKKGCYPGQEIVARTYSQGEVRRRLFGLASEEAVGWENVPGAKDFFVKGKKSGEVRRAAYSPSLGRFIALAYLPREMAYPGMDFEIEYAGKKHRVRVVKPPFYVKPSLAGSARAAYEAGMALYHQGEWQAALKKFEESQQILPGPDTCEALALTLERLGKTDESILWNQRFAELDPNAVMARTNLSRLYMQKGLIERAEKEKAKATALGFRLAAAEASGKKNVASVPAEDPDADRLRKKNLFEKVLAMDAKDEIANFGMGKWYFDKKDYSAALPHLRTVIEQNAGYSMAYFLLGKSLLETGSVSEGEVILTKGMAVAREKGELMPLRAMEEALGKGSSISN